MIPRFSKLILPNVYGLKTIIDVPIKIGIHPLLSLFLKNMDEGFRKSGEPVLLGGDAHFLVGRAADFGLNLRRSAVYVSGPSLNPQQ